MHNLYKKTILPISLSLLVSCQTLSEFEDNVSFAPKSNDTTITTAILESMLENENTSNLTIHVQTTNGVVSLSGYVKTIRQSDTSEDISRKTVGVKSVKNNIVVRK